jgi:L-fuconate dehydratase
VPLISELLIRDIAGRPLWKLLADMSPEQLASCADFRYLTDAITPDEVVLMLHQLAPTKTAGEAQMLATGYPAYATSAGRLGYSDEKLRRLCREAIAAGWSHLKIKVGRDLVDDIDRCTIIYTSRYLPRTRPGYSIQMKAQSLADHEFPGGNA